MILTQQLETIIAQSFDKGKFNSAKFFRLWFEVHGSAHLVIFRANIKVTNLQYAEMIGLLKKFHKSRSPSNTRISFASPTEFKSVIEELAKIHLSSSTRININRFINQYKQVLFSYCVITPLKGCCAVYINPAIHLDMNRICAYSGYIHSCGKLIFLRNVDKANYPALEKAMTTHLRAYPTRKKRPFIAYAHEDFSGHDRDQSGFLKNGLDDLKIYISKHYLGNDTIYDAIEKLKKKFSRRLLFPAPGNYQKAQAELMRAKKEDIAIWLITDQNIIATPKEKESRSYILYEQTAINQNNLHIFDEDKPGWNNHITIPHTLAGAIANIAILQTSKSKISVCDPFCGSATYLIEAAKYSHTTLQGFDLDPIVPLMHLDNVRYFNLKRSGLKKMVKFLGKISGHLSFVAAN